MSNMTLPSQRTHWRLSEIAEELENLDLSLDMDFTKDMDEFLKGSSLSTTATIYSSTDVAGPKDKVKVESESGGYVDFTKDIPKTQEKKKKSHYAKCRGRGPVMPKVPPPPPPTQIGPTPPPTPPTPPTPQSIPESPAPLPPPVVTPLTNCVLPVLPTTVSAESSVTSSSVTTSARISQSSLEDLPPPPPIFDLPEPVFSPPSPCSSPLVMNHEPRFGLNRLKSPLALSTSLETTSVSETTSSVYAPTSVASTSSDQPSELSDDADVFEKITDEDIQQIEMFYKSHKSHVYVCPGIANLYLGSAVQTGNGEKWELLQTGIPVLLLDSGDGRRIRKLQIILAEKGSGFILWKDYIDQLSNFKSLHSKFQTMYLSNDHTKLAGLSYDDENAASDFLSTLQEFTSNPNDEALTMGRIKKKKKVKKSKYKPPKKTDISQPCGFVHVTKLDRSDHEQYVNNVSTPILATRNPNNMSL